MGQQLQLVGINNKDFVYIFPFSDRNELSYDKTVSGQFDEAYTSDAYVSFKKDTDIE